MMLLLKLLAFQRTYSQTKSAKSRLNRFETKNSDLLAHIQKTLRKYGDPSKEEQEDEDVVPDELLLKVPDLPIEDFRISDMLADNYFDLNQIVDFLEELRKFKPSHDDKLAALKRTLKSNPLLKKYKVLIFTEYMHTAHYLKNQLQKSGFKQLDEVDSSDKRDRGDIISSFAPYYNDSSSSELKEAGLEEIKILISTDVLSEGLNLQDATLVINYDIHGILLG